MQQAIDLAKKRESKSWHSVECVSCVFLFVPVYRGRRKTRQKENQKSIQREREERVYGGRKGEKERGRWEREDSYI